RLNRAGVTVVYTSHYMEEVQALCPRVGILDRGHLIACDRVAELLQRHDGRIRFQVVEDTLALRDRLRALPNARLIEHDGRPLELVGRETRAVLAQLAAALAELKVKL